MAVSFLLISGSPADTLSIYAIIAGSGALIPLPPRYLAEPPEFGYDPPNAGLPPPTVGKIPPYLINGFIPPAGPIPLF
jgi:hypothetical protein